MKGRRREAWSLREMGAMSAESIAELRRDERERDQLEGVGRSCFVRARSGGGVGGEECVEELVVAPVSTLGKCGGVLTAVGAGAVANTGQRYGRVFNPDQVSAVFGDVLPAHEHFVAFARQYTLFCSVPNNRAGVSYPNQ